MELHDLAEYRLSRTRRIACLAIPENGRPCDAAHDEQAGCNGTLQLAAVRFSFAHRHEATTRVANVRLCRRFQGHARLGTQTCGGALFSTSPMKRVALYI